MNLTNVIYKTAAVLFGGIGGATKGLLNSQMEYGGKLYKFKILCSIDSDPVACHNHDLITGEKTSVLMDLFRKWQYVAWHGHQPPADWREVTAWDLWVSFGYQVPFFLFTSPPCKGLSGLLPQGKANSDKYQALNFLTVSGLELALQACYEYGGSVPAIIQLENVPRITSRGKNLLKQIEKLLKKFGYAVSFRADHNLGKIGGLAEDRVRFLIMARHEAQIPNSIYYPELKPMQTIGDVINHLPTPGDTVAGGPLNRLPRLQWKTWMRLALINAGGDWRDLNSVDFDNLRVIPESILNREGKDTTCSTNGFERVHVLGMISNPRLNISGNGKSNLYRLQAADEAAGCITGAAGPNQGATCISDPRLVERAGRHPAAYRVVKIDGPAPCVTGTRLGSGALAISDPCVNTNLYLDSSGVQEKTTITDPLNKRVFRSNDSSGMVNLFADTECIDVIDAMAVPGDDERGVWVIIAQDGTWHRPLTTYELAMIQSFPQFLPDGRPFQLEGCSDAKAREYIGNAVPPDAEEDMGNVMLLAAAEAEAGLSFSLTWNQVWVAPKEDPEIEIQSMLN